MDCFELISVMYINMCVYFLLSTCRVEGDIGQRYIIVPNILTRLVRGRRYIVFGLYVNVCESMVAPFVVVSRVYYMYNRLDFIHRIGVLILSIWCVALLKSV